jgi:hypothetical protein
MRQRTYDITGWSLFGAGCVFFIAQGIRTDAPLTVVGSALFLIGVIVVLIPYARTG